VRGQHVARPVRCQHVAGCSHPIPRVEPVGKPHRRPVAGVRVGGCHCVGGRGDASGRAPVRRPVRRRSVAKSVAGPSPLSPAASAIEPGRVIASNFTDGSWLAFASSAALRRRSGRRQRARPGARGRGRFPTPITGGRWQCIGGRRCHCVGRGDRGRWRGPGKRGRGWGGGSQPKYCTAFVGLSLIKSGI
jgi:hypothetical protein